MKIRFQLLVISFQIGICGYGQIQNSGDFRMHSGAEIGIFGDFTNNGNFNNNLGTVYLVGSNAQTFNGTNLIQSNNFVVDKASGSLQLDNELQVSGILTFTKGIIYSDHADKATEFVHFQDGATYLNASDASHVDGVVRKTGNDAFVFPVGDDSNLQSIAIDVPSLATDAFTAEYFETDADALYDRSLKEISIDHLSSCEYWILDRTNGTSNVNVTLEWDLNSCGVDNLSDLLVARWDGAEWKNHGNSLTTGNASAGTVTTSGAVSSFGPFTLGSTTSNNPLPIELTSFTAKKVENVVVLEWVTASEINNDYFTIERSDNCLDFESLITVQGAGNSTATLNYAAIDYDPLRGVSYYRLKQTDFDGNEKSFQIIAINNVIENDGQLTLFPNPSLPDFFNLVLPVNKEFFELYVIDDLGNLIFSEDIVPLGNQSIPIHPKVNLVPGHYIVKLVSEDEYWTSQLIIY